MQTTVKERPILFSAPMVRAILDGRKTQTRRVVKDRVKNGGQWFTRTPSDFANDEMLATYKCPYGQPGDQLWVREAFRLDADFDHMSPAEAGAHCRDHDHGAGALYEATESTDDGWGKLRPSIHMPRWASRITLEVTDVRVERLQEISETDAYAEGVTIPTHYQFGGTACMTREQVNLRNEARVTFEDLWDSLNAKRGYGWDVNPWVWVVTFKRAEPHHGGGE